MNRIIEPLYISLHPGLLSMTDKLADQIDFILEKRIINLQSSKNIILFWIAA